MSSNEIEDALMEIRSAMVGDDIPIELIAKALKMKPEAIADTWERVKNQKEEEEEEMTSCSQGHYLLAHASAYLWPTCEYAVRYGLYHASESGHDVMKGLLFAKMGRKWEWMEAKGELDGFGVAGAQLAALGDMQAERIGPLLRKWSHRSSAEIAQYLCMYGGAEMEGEVRGVAGGVFVTGVTKNALSALDLVVDRGVGAMAETPSGRLVCGGVGKSLNEWDLNTGECVRSFRGHTDEVVWLLVSQAHGQLISGGKDATIRIWSLDKGTEVQVLGSFPKWISDAALVDEEGRSFVTCGRELMHFVADDSGSWTMQRSLEPEGLDKLAICSLPGGRIACSGDDRHIRIWDLSSGKVLAKLRGHTVNAVSLACVGDSLVSASMDWTVRLWNAQDGSGKILHKGSRPQVAVVTLPFSGDVVTASSDGVLCMMDPVSGTVKNIWGAQTVVSRLIALSDGRLVSCSRSGPAMVWNPTSMNNGVQERFAIMKSTFLGSSAKNARVVTGWFEGCVTVYSPFEHGQEPTVESKFQLPGFTRWVKLLSAGESIVTVTTSGTQVWRAEANEWRPASAILPFTAHLVMSDGYTLVGLSSEHLAIWSEERGLVVLCEPRLASSLSALNDTTVVAVGRDNSVLQFDVATASLIQGPEFSPQQLRLGHLMSVGDGRRVMASGSGTVWELDMETGAMRGFPKEGKGKKQPVAMYEGMLLVHSSWGGSWDRPNECIEVYDTEGDGYVRDSLFADTEIVAVHVVGETVILVEREGWNAFESLSLKPI